MYKPGGTIHDLLKGVAEHQYILPAIQREFVWGPDQICKLFDSLMQSYPFGTFLFWKIEPEQQSLYQFYDFVQHFHQRDSYHCELGFPEFCKQRCTTLKARIQAALA